MKNMDLAATFVKLPAQHSMEQRPRVRARNILLRDSRRPVVQFRGAVDQRADHLRGDGGVDGAEGRVRDAVAQYQREAAGRTVEFVDQPAAYFSAEVRSNGAFPES